MFNLELIEENQMPAALDAEIRGLLCACFPAETDAFSKTRHWHGTAPSYSLVHRTGKTVTGHVGVVVREVNAGGAKVMIAGIQNLAVAAAHRGTGLSRALMEESMDEARRRGFSFGLLFCVEGLRKFYESLGWKERDIQTWMKDGTGRRVPIPRKNIVMVRELEKKHWPSGDIDLLGADW